MAALIQFKDGVEGITLRLENRVSSLGRGPENDITINDDLSAATRIQKTWIPGIYIFKRNLK